MNVDKALKVLRVFVIDGIYNYVCCHGCRTQNPPVLLVLIFVSIIVIIKIFGA